MIQTLIAPGTLTPLLRTASQFVDRRAPADYAAFIGFPEPGPRVDFTRDKTAVRKAMQTISIGQASSILTGRFDISLYEAFAITGPERAQDADRDKPPGPLSDGRRVRDRFRKFEWPVSSDTVVNRSTCVHIPGAPPCQNASVAPQSYHSGLIRPGRDVPRGNPGTGRTRGQS